MQGCFREFKWNQCYSYYSLSTQFSLEFRWIRWNYESHKFSHFVVLLRESEHVVSSAVVVNVGGPFRDHPFWRSYAGACQCYRTCIHNKTKTTAAMARAAEATTRIATPTTTTAASATRSPPAPLPTQQEEQRVKARLLQPRTATATTMGAMASGSLGSSNEHR